MRKYGRIHFNDPEDLSDWSNCMFTLFLQLEVIDCARRYYKRQNDKNFLRRSEELKKFLLKISDMQTEAIRSLIPEEILKKLGK